MPHWNDLTDCEVPVVEPNKTAHLFLECFGRRAGERTEDHCRLDAGQQRAAHSCAWSSLASGPKKRRAADGWQRFFGGLERVVAGLH
jgi:cation transport regulator ChaB